MTVGARLLRSLGRARHRLRLPLGVLFGDQLHVFLERRDHLPHLAQLALLAAHLRPQLQHELLHVLRRRLRLLLLELCVQRLQLGDPLLQTLQ